ncbi:MAG: tetratricopeptide repeat protein [Alphaproteobacteria bacterium]|nr:tetratricopeptide repeat protein [Alphaproteobacteria bacterium]MBV9371389.1 tetratricopeptide repeat protein [Alphaproteobacteria bacterium]MBV9901853.1 tetratricopeptide repeat protein [Alphaproteobacteria bacterium]
MPLIGLSILVQILCAIHCIRNGRNGLWLMVIIFFSVIGCLAYAFFEILPQYAGRREVRAAKAAAVRRLDPERALRAARDALDLADTAANRIALADALAESGAWREAADHYRRALAKTPGPERATRLKLGRALLEGGDAAGARRELEALPPSASQTENDRGALLLARSLEECGQTERALELYGEVGPRLAGGEALCRHAALLIKAGREAEAVPLLAEVEARAKRLDRMERARDAAMYDWAARTLAELR